MDRYANVQRITEIVALLDVPPRELAQPVEGETDRLGRVSSRDAYRAHRGRRHLYGGAAQVGYLLEGLTGRGVENLLLCPPGSELGAAAPAARVRALPMRGELDVMLLPRLVAELNV